MTQLVEHLLCDQKVVGLISGQVIPKTLKMVLIALLLGSQHNESSASNQNWSLQCQYKVNGWNIMSCVWGIIFQ